MFVNDNDYKVVIGDKAYEVISQADYVNRMNAETEAREEISGYLRPKYDVDALFAQEGSQRNRLIVMYMCDIALYHMSASLPGRMNQEVRKERYDRAIEWLKDVQAGKIVPDIPVAVNADGSSKTPMHFGYDTRTGNVW